MGGNVNSLAAGGPIFATVSSSLRWAFAKRSNRFLHLTTRSKSTQRTEEYVVRHPLCHRIVSILSGKCKIANALTGPAPTRLHSSTESKIHQRKNTMRKAIWIAAIIAVAAACGIGVKAHAAPPADTVQVGATAPNFTLPSQEDKPVSLADYKGKWV